MAYSLLRLTDGTIAGTVNLLSLVNGFHLSDWEPVVAEAKGGGVWHDSALADGRQLVLRQLGNVIETFSLKVNEDCSQDLLIQDLQNLRRLLEKALAYFTTSWQQQPVWIEARAPEETNTRYALIHDYRTSGDSNPFAAPFFGTGKLVVDNFDLILERSAWQSTPPGTGECVPAANLPQSENYRLGTWAANTTDPTGTVTCLIETSTGRLLAGDLTSNKVWRTDDGGVTAWTGSAALADGIVCLVQGSGTIIYGASAGGVYRSLDNGSTWALASAAVVVAATDQGMYALQWRSQGDALFICNPAGDKLLYRSTNQGITWAVVAGAPTGIESFQILPDGSMFLSAAVGQIYKSLDGLTWTWLSSPRPTTYGIFSGFKRMQYPGDGYLYIFPLIAGFLRSTDGLDWTWIYINNAQYASMLYTSSKELYICFIINGYIYRGLAGGTSFRVDTILGGDGIWARQLAEHHATKRVFLAIEGAVWVNSTLVETSNMGQPATCLDEVLVANKSHLAQITHVFVYDATGPVWTSQFPAAAFPFGLFPAVPAVEDYTYFGIASAAADAGPFTNLVFNLSAPSRSAAAFVWQYSQGAGVWATLTTTDLTQAFNYLGVSSVHWEPPALWAADDVNGVTGLWVRVVGKVMPTCPLQASRNVYVVNQAGLSVAASAVLGDLPALLRLWLTNRADKDAANTPHAWDDRILIGLRSDYRGAYFQPFLNCSDVQIPLGLTLTGTAATVAAAAISTATGRKYVHTGTGTSIWATQLAFSLTGLLAASYSGRFRVFLRAQQSSGASGEVRIRLQLSSGAGAALVTGEAAIFNGTDDWQVLDLGSFIIPTSDMLKDFEQTDQLVFSLQAWSSAARTVNLYDLVLLPTDEWCADCVDSLLATTSRIGAGYLLDLDSVSYPKQENRALVRVGSSDNGLVRGNYSLLAAGPAILQANTAQHLYVFCLRYTSGVWSSEPWVCHSAHLQAAFRYLAARGTR